MSEKYQCIKTTAKDLKETYKNETMDKIFEDFAEALNDYQDFGCESCKAQDKLKDKIAELESKLAESEKDRLMWQEMYKSADRQNKSICETDIYPLQEENQQLKDKLEIKLEELHIAYCGIENVKTKNGNLKAEVKQLKQQCQECKHINKKIELNIKNKLMNEIDKLKQQIIEEKNRNKKLNHEAQKYYEDAYCNGFQNKKAIDQLEKVKENIKLKDKDGFVVHNRTTILHFIDQQIAELKGEK